MNEFENAKLKDLSFGGYHGQSVDLRTFGIELFGAEEVAKMSDEMLEHNIIEKGYVPMLLNHYGNNEETVYLIEADYLNKCRKLER